MSGHLMLPATTKTTVGTKREHSMKCGGSSPYHRRDSLAKMDTKSKVPSMPSNYASSCRNCCKKISRSKSLDLSIQNLASLTLDLIEFWKQFPVKTREIATLRELTKCQLLKIESQFAHGKHCEDSNSILLEGSRQETLYQETNESVKEELDNSEGETESEKKDKNEVSSDNDKAWNPWNGSTIDYYTSNSRDSHMPELSYNYLLITKGNGFQPAQRTFSFFFAETKGFLGHTGNTCVCRDTDVRKKPLYQR